MFFFCESMGTILFSLATFWKKLCGADKKNPSQELKKQEAAN